MRTLVGLFLAALMAVALIAPANAAKLKVVASFSILADLTAHVGGDDIELTMLVGPDSDVHVFHADAKHARAVASAQVFIANGRGLDAWAQRVLVATGSKAKLVTLTDGIVARPNDPHAWQDVRNVVAYVEKIRSALVASSPRDRLSFDMRAKDYTNELEALHRDVKAMIASVASRNRKVITTHDAFGFFGDAYGVKFVAPLGVSTENQASAKAVAVLISQIRREKIKALFLENISDNRLMTQIAKETGTTMGGKLYSDALSDKNGPAADFVSMMRHNARLLTDAMAKGS